MSQPLIFQHYKWLNFLIELKNQNLLQLSMCLANSSKSVLANWKLTVTSVYDPLSYEVVWAQRLYISGSQLQSVIMKQSLRTYRSFLLWKVDELFNILFLLWSDMSIVFVSASCSFTYFIKKNNSLKNQTQSNLLSNLWDMLTLSFLQKLINIQ